MHALYRDHMGNDLSVVQDARISFDKTSSAIDYELIEIPQLDTAASQKYANIPLLKSSDVNLIGFLARGCRSGEWQEILNKASEVGMSTEEAADFLRHVRKMATHWTPFGHQVIKLRMKAPVPIRTQCFKSKIGFVENEESRRYISSTPEIFIPEFRYAPEGDIKQGSGGIHQDNGLLKEAYTSHTNSAVRLYEQFIKDGVAPEQARFILPQGAMVNWVWTGSLYAYAEWFNKRVDRSHSQGEIADLALEVGRIMKTLFPVSWEALTEI